MMEDKIIVTNENNETKEYQLLAILDKEYKYLIYTDNDNTDYKKNIYAIKVNKLNNNESTINITDTEWEMIEKEYYQLFNKKNA